MVTYFNKKDLISFGNYLLSCERDEKIMATGNNNFENVTHADFQNWKSLEQKRKSKK